MVRKPILIVDDEPGVRRLFSRVLLRAGYSIAEASDGVEAIAVAREREPALILMDLDMPRKNGWEAAAELKADPATASIRIVATSARDVFEGGAGPFAEFLSKPITPELLLSAVERLAEGQAP